MAENCSARAQVLVLGVLLAPTAITAQPRGKVFIPDHAQSPFFISPILWWPS